MLRGTIESVTALALLASACSRDASSADGGTAIIDAPATSDAPIADDTSWPETGILVATPTEEPVLMDHAMVFNRDRLGSTEPVVGHANLELIFWPWEESCDVLLDPLDDTPFEFVQLFITVRGARVDEMIELPPTVGDYPIAPGAEMTVQPVVPQTATVAFLLIPTGVARAVSGVVSIESIDADEAVLSVDAVLEGGRTVRGRMPVGRECR